MKALIVIDMPDGYETDEVLIDYTLHTKGVYKALRKGGNHELIPFPERIGTDFDTYDSKFSTGYNYCLDEILRNADRWIVGETEW